MRLSITLFQVTIFCVCLANVYSQELANNSEPSPGIHDKADFSIIADIENDPAFAKFVDWKIVSSSVHEINVEGIIDSALLLAEAEQVLLRNHSHIRSDYLLGLAFYHALAQGNDKAIERIRRAADKYGYADLKVKIDLMGKSRSGSKDQLEKCSPEEALLVDLVGRDIDGYISNGNINGLMFIEQWIEKSNMCSDTISRLLVKKIDDARENAKTLSQMEREARKLISGTSRATYRFEVLNTTSRPVEVVVMWIVSGQTSTSSSSDGVASSYTPPESICRGWFVVDPKSPKEIFSGSQQKIFVYFANGITPKKYYRKVQHPIHYGTRFEISKMPPNSSNATFQTGGTGASFATSRNMTIDQAVNNEGWTMVDFYEIDTGHFTVNE